MLTRAARDTPESSQSELVATRLTGAREQVSLGLHCDRVHFAAGHGICIVFDASFRGLSRQALRQFVDRDQDAQSRGVSESCPGFTRRSSWRYHDVRGGSLVLRQEFLDEDDSRRSRLRPRARGARAIRIRPRQRCDYRQGSEFLGVTFASGGDRFYATLSTQGKTYLVPGSVSGRDGPDVARRRRVSFVFAGRNPGRIQEARFRQRRWPPMSSNSRRVGTSNLRNHARSTTRSSGWTRPAYSYGAEAGGVGAAGRRLRRSDAGTWPAPTRRPWCTSRKRSPSCAPVPSCEL